MTIYLSINNTDDVIEVTRICPSILFHWHHIPIPEPYQAGPREDGRYCWNGHGLGAFRLPQALAEYRLHPTLLKSRL